MPVRRSLLRTRDAIQVRARARCTGICSCHSTDSSCFKMSTSQDAARAINRFASEGYDLLGTSDGPALQNFLEDYFCGNDPANGDLLSGTVSPHNKVC